MSSNSIGEGKRTGIPHYDTSKHPKTGPRDMQRGDYEKFNDGLAGIDWSKKSGWKECPPTCPLCNMIESNENCPIC